MKKIFSLTLAMALGLSMFNCSDDDSDNNDNNNNNNNAANVLTYDGEEHEIKSALLVNYGAWDGVYNFDVSLVDTEISIVDGYPMPENNVFSEIYFELFTANEAGLEPGTYTFSPNDIAANTFDYGNVAFNYNFETDEAESYYEITSGTFTLLENGTSFKVEIEGTTDEGAEFSGSYEGEVAYFDASVWDEEGRSSVKKAFSKRK